LWEKRFPEGSVSVARHLTITLAAAVIGLAGEAGSVGAAPIVSVGTAIPLSPTTVVLPVEITGAVALTAWQFDLAYDPADLQINTGCFPGDPYCGLFTGPVTEGELLGALSPFNLFNPGFITEDPATFQQAGLLLAVNDTFGGALPGPSGDGVLAYVQFLVVGDGTSEVRVLNAAVSEEPVPEPATLTLLTTGLGVLGASRWRRRVRARSQRDGGTE
jgi:hypothetical protein